MTASKIIRNIAAWCVSIIFMVSGATKRAKKRALNGEYILSIYFHTPSKQLFEFCIKWLIRNQFTPLTQAEVAELCQGNRPFPKGGVIITLDDGWQSNIRNVVAVAEKYKVPVSIFIAVKAILNGEFWWCYAEKASAMKLIPYSVEHLKTLQNEEREEIVDDVKRQIRIDRLAMTLTQLKQIAKSDYVTIGSHTMSHPILIKCSDERSRMEIKQSKEVLEKWLQAEIKYFAYPNGDYSAREINHLKELQYELAYTTVPVYLSALQLKNAYELPRFEVFEEVSRAEAICRMLGVWQTTRKKI